MLRRLMSRLRATPDASHVGTLEKVPDSHPKSGLFTEPVRVASIQVPDPEPLDDSTGRVSFLVEVRDADDKRCPQFFVEATVTSPDRSRTVSGTTDLLGRIRFRTTGGAGTYLVEITDVGAGGVTWDPAAGPRTASASFTEPG